LLKKKLFASWDRFMVPYPWSRGLYVWGSPIWVPRDADEQAMEAACLELEKVLNQLTDQAEKAVKR
jgi:lysophospholipid acyltransferase (LPLAT)-like uncharacterized protein